jgi:hypothetical protein
MYAQGCSANHIAKLLSEDKILCPMAQRYKNLNREIPYKKAYTIAWSPLAIRRILSNECHIGNMVNSKNKKISFKSKLLIATAKEERILVEGTHEAIIDIDTFSECQERLEGNRSRITKEKEVSLFSSFLKCADCSSILGCNSKRYKLKNKESKIYRFYGCNRYRTYGRKACSGHFISSDYLKEIVLKDIQSNANLAKNENKLLFDKLSKKLGLNKKDKIPIYENELLSFKNRKKEAENLIQKLFEEKYSTGISEQIFRNLMKKYSDETEDINSKIKNLEDKLLNFKDSEKQISSWINVIKQYEGIGSLDRAILTKLIDKIIVFEKYFKDGVKIQRIKILYKFVGDLS